MPMEKGDHMVAVIASNVIGEREVALNLTETKTVELEP